MQGLVYPLELVRTRMTVSPQGTYKGIADAAITIFRQEGMLSFYRNICLAMVRLTIHVM